MEAELAELRQVSEAGTELTSEVEAGEAELADAVLETDNAAPVAWSRRRGGIPAVKGAERVPEAALEGE